MQDSSLRKHREIKVNIDFQICALSSFSCSMISFACVEPDIACQVNQLNVEKDFQIPMFVKKAKEEASENNFQHLCHFM